MTVYLQRGCRRYSYDFQFRGQRYTGSTGMSRKGDAEEWERKERVRLERQSGDLALRAGETPRMQDFAEVFYTYKTTRRPVKRPDLLQREVRVVLEFCGARQPDPPAPATGARRPPRRRAVVDAPYHDLRLGDFVEQPAWIERFEAWLHARGTGGSARNHYRSVLSGMYRVAMLPQFRAATGVRSNPFLGIERDRPTRRRVTQSVDEIRAWVQHASPHVRAALVIGALAPALRLGSILALEWDTHIDPEFRFLTITDHKGDQAQPEPLVIPIVQQLRTILQQAHARWVAARQKNPRIVANVVQFRGRAVKSIKNGLRQAARRAKLRYGVTLGGATFHTLRHSMATLLADLGVAEQHRKELLAHQDIATTQIYTHLRPAHLVAPLEQLSGAVALEDVLATAPTVPRGGRHSSRR